MTIAIDGWPPSLNDTYAVGRVKVRGRWRGTMVKSRKASKYQESVVEQIVRAGNADFVVAWRSKPRKMVLSLTFVGRWESEAGRPLVKDVSNRIKLIEDAIGAALGYDDSWNWKVVVEKQHDLTAQEYVLVEVAEWSC